LDRRACKLRNVSKVTVPAGEVALVTSNVNSSAAGRDLLYFTERGSGPPLLLVHGLMITGEMFEPVIDHFAERHRVIVPDLRGHGRSRVLPPPYTAPQVVSDLARLLDHLRIDSTAVLGYSHGGAIAQQLVLDYPTRCSRLVLACTYAFNMITFRERIEGYLVPIVINILGMRRLAKFVISRGLKQVSKERADRVLELIANQDGKLMVSAWRAAMAFDSRRRLAEIKRPTLVVAAANDAAVPFHHAKMLRDGINGSQLVVIDGADHALIWERPDEFVRVVEKFLAA
jgi:pimeloyl-ACP methyl ester carboxylesterase